MRTFTFIICLLAALSANAQILNVPGTYPTIQAGINAAQPGDTVLVAEGFYYEKVNFMGKPITVASNYIMDGNPGHIESTILDGSMMSEEYGSVVVFGSGEDTTSILNGFTIQNGKGTMVDSGFVYYRWGGGIYIDRSGAKIINNRIVNNTLYGYSNQCPGGAGISTPFSGGDYWVVIENNTIENNQCLSDYYDAAGAAIISCYNTRLRNNVIKYNTSNSDGGAFGAVFLVSRLSFQSNWLTMQNNIISYNAAVATTYNVKGSGVLISHFKAVVTGNDISNNEIVTPYTAHGGAGIYFENMVSCLLKSNTFIDNTASCQGGAINQYGGNEIVVENNTFISNQAKTGGAIYSNTGNLYLVNNVFQQNKAVGNSGGAVYVRRTGTPLTATRLVNNSFSENSAITSGGALYSYGCNPELLNNIFWQDSSATGAEIIFAQGKGFLAYSNIDTEKIQGQVDILDGMMFCDPMFCDTACLKPLNTSECLDAGTAEYIFTNSEGQDTLYAPSYDLAGTFRPLNSGYDMGAYEVDINSHVRDLGLSVQFTLSPNPFTTKLDCSYKLQSESQVTITLYTLTGITVSTWQTHQPAGDYTKTLDLKNQSKGVYLLELKVNGTASSRKIVKI